MDIICLDLEGVLVPEIWIAFAQETGIDALKATTRDLPVYDDLMRQRLAILDEQKLDLRQIQSVIAGMSPMPGAREFLDELREAYQVVILSDTFYDFAKPLMAQLGWPTLFCHRLEVGADSMITGYRLRQEDPKRQSVKALQSLNYRVLASGDSYNDTSMLEQADAGFLFRPPQQVIDEFPQYPVAEDYATLLALFRKASLTMPEA